MREAETVLEREIVPEEVEEMVADVEVLGVTESEAVRETEEDALGERECVGEGEPETEGVDDVCGVIVFVVIGVAAPQ